MRDTLRIARARDVLRISMSKTTPASPKTSKSAFIRSLPATMPAKDVVTKARLVGMKLTDAYVYAIRSASKRPKKARMRAGGAHGVAPSTGTEELLKAVAAEIGLGRAIELLEAERARVRAVLA
jgi:hypothetical protein